MKLVRKFYSISGRLRAAKSTYKSSKEYYDSDDFKKDQDQAIEVWRNELRTGKAGDWTKTEEGKRAAIGETRKLIEKAEKDKRSSSRMKALKSAYYEAFRNPYWAEHDPKAVKRR